MYFIIVLLCTAWYTHGSDQYSKKTAQLEALHKEIEALQAEISSLVIERTQKIEHLRRLLKLKKSDNATIVTTKQEQRNFLYKDTQCNIQ